jgi:hypothetical protein
LDVEAVAPEAMEAVLGIEAYIHRCGREPGLIHPAKMQALQISGCAIETATPGSLTRLLSLTIGAFTIGTEGFMIAALLAALARDLNVGLSAAGYLVTAFSLTYAIGAPVIAMLTAGLERRRLLLLYLGVFLADVAGLGPQGQYVRNTDPRQQNGTQGDAA